MFVLQETYLAGYLTVPVLFDIHPLTRNLKATSANSYYFRSSTCRTSQCRALQTIMSWSTPLRCASWQFAIMFDSLRERWSAQQIPGSGSAVRSWVWPVHQTTQWRTGDGGDAQYWKMGHRCHRWIPQWTPYEVNLCTACWWIELRTYSTFFVRYFARRFGVEWQCVTAD